RMIAFLIEAYAGAFPLWLAPEQVRVLPITDRQVSYARQVGERLRTAGVRVEVDASNERIAYKIRQAQVMKVPYMLVVGEREVSSARVAVRRRDGEDLGPMTVDAFLQRLQQEVAAKA
ncbi:MAG: His/Gly/Thr/Pro-type tRNA ligase C-terminal domain-containing protein, partial [Armatimonadota bacterium]|nr:His/Gly/Thr/Pro-type tRNA ligase C-terminal domain-containing protein [Armatimonadota bacterium]